MNNPSQTFDNCTRRSFIKRSVLTAGAITFLSAGTALAGSGDYISGAVEDEDCPKGGKHNIVTKTLEHDGRMFQYQYCTKCHKSWAPYEV